MWRAYTRSATIESMIRETMLLNRRAVGSARPGRSPLSSFRAVWSRLSAWTRARPLPFSGMRETTARTGAPGTSHPVPKPRQLRPIVVPASLDELHGPSCGLVTPPRRLWWSGEEGAAFDLNNPVQAVELYEAIFDTARTYSDITDHLDADLLIELWPDLGMRRATREAWEAAHPILAAATASGHAA